MRKCALCGGSLRHSTSVTHKEISWPVDWRVWAHGACKGVAVIHPIAPASIASPRTALPHG